VLIAFLNAVTAATIADQFATAADRAAFARQMEALPALFQGLLGKPLNIETLPGFISWRLVGFLPIMIGFYSIVALTGTLAGEAASGTLEMLLATPVSRVKVALQKYAAHVSLIVIAAVLVAVGTWLGNATFATLPEDAMSIFDSLSEFALVALMSLFAGSIGFAIAPLLGRGVGAGVGAIYLFGSYAVNGYADMVPGFGVLRTASMFFWTQNHRPMAGFYDWPAVGLVLALTVLFAVIGIVLFQRRDLAATVSVFGQLRRRGAEQEEAEALADGAQEAGGPSGRSPLRVLRRTWQLFTSAATGRWSLYGPGLRSLGERLPAALAWGAGLGFYGFFIAASADEFSKTLLDVPQIMELIRTIYPDIDFSTAGGILQLAIFGFVALVAGVAASTLVAGWASDERARRLEVVLSAPVQRVSWFIRSALGVLISALVVGVVIGLLTGLGGLVAGDAPFSIFMGGVVVGVYAAALAGFGILIFGIGFPQFAAGAVAAATLAFYLIDLLGGILDLPDVVKDLALTRHLGQPMAGVYDGPGMALCFAVIVGGTLIGAWGFARRDLG
jgi:ABC-2 type transport system permease protein